MSHSEGITVRRVCSPHSLRDVIQLARKKRKKSSITSWQGFQEIVFSPLNEKVNKANKCTYRLEDNCSSECISVCINLFPPPSVIPPQTHTEKHMQKSENVFFLFAFDVSCGRDETEMCGIKKQIRAAGIEGFTHQLRSAFMK